MGGKYGEPIPHDPDFQGPKKGRHRSCTDVIFLLLFIVFIAWWIAVGVYSFKNGDPKSILIPKDSLGLRCGVDSDVRSKPYLFFFDLTKCIGPSVPFLGCPTPQVCVEECPNKFFTPVDNYDRKDLICKYKTPDDEKKPDGEICAKWYLKSKPVQNRCLPIISKDIIDELRQINISIPLLNQAIEKIQLEQVGENVVNDLALIWKPILIGLVLVLVGCLVYIILLRWVAFVMVWISIIGVILVLSAGVYKSFLFYKDLKVLADSDETDGSPFFETRRYLWLALLVICSVSLLVILLMVIFLRKRISLAVTLIEEGSKAVTSVTSVLFFPIIPWILQLTVITFALSVGLMLTTTGTPIFQVKISHNNTNPECTRMRGLPCNPDNYVPNKLCKDECNLKGMEHTKYYNYFHLTNVVGFFWGLFFVSAFGQMVLAFIFATWYWTRPRSKLPFFAITTAIAKVMRYHLGTLALGSLIITICRMIRLVLEYIDRKLKKYDNEFTRAIMCLLKCFFWCLEKFLKFLNTNAYIMCAIHGKNFCRSAKDAFFLLMRNILRVFVLDKVTDFLFFLSTLLLSFGAGAATYYFFYHQKQLKLYRELNYIEVPVALLSVSTFCIASIFFGVYSMAVDTLFLCFLEDCERNDGSPEKPYYMSKDLMKVFGKRNKAE